MTTTNSNINFNFINILDDYHQPANALFWITVWITAQGPSTSLHGPGLLMQFASQDRLSIGGAGLPGGGAWALGLGPW